MINGKCSDSVDISIGCPQGSVLSPILFACFINDVVDHVRNCRFHLYADDLQIICGWVRGRELVGCS
jgi:hypothetical protein